MNYLFEKKIIISLTVFFLTGLSAPAKAQEEVGLEELLQEFFIGETVYAQEKREIQFTSKPSYWRTKEGLEIINIPLLFEYGITDRFQVELQLPYNFLFQKGQPSVCGSGNLEAGFLYNIINGKKAFALSLALDIGFPTEKREKEAEDPEIEWEPSVILAGQLGKMQVHGSLAAEMAKSGSSLNYNMAVVIPFGNLRGTLEVNGEFREKRTVYLTPGLVWKGIDDFEFGLGISRGRTEWGVFFMATYEFSLRKK